MRSSGPRCAAPPARLKALFPLCPAGALQAVDGPAVGQILDEAPGDAALRNHGGEGMLLVTPLRPPHPAQLLLGDEHQTIRRPDEGPIPVGRAFLDLEGPRAWHPKGQVALLRLAAVAVVPPHFHAQL